MLTLETRRTHAAQCPPSSDEQGKEQTDIHNGARGKITASGNINNTDVVYLRLQGHQKVNTECHTKLNPRMSVHISLVRRGR